MQELKGARGREANEGVKDTTWEVLRWSRWDLGHRLVWARLQVVA